MKKNTPNHIAIIMDGNGRWATSNGYARFVGHNQGSETAQNIVEHCARSHPEVSYLTLFAFSTENWSRPAEEVKFLFGLLDKHIIQKQSRLLENNVKIECLGDLSKLSSGLRKKILELQEKSKGNSGLTLCLALNYGGRQEILQAVTKAALQISRNELPLQELDEDLFASFLPSSHIPDPDLIIRTSGEKRLSNFFLWQSAYSELYFVKKHWPEFTNDDFDDAVLEYIGRNRKFGNIQTVTNISEARS